MSQPRSENVPSALQALRIAVTSACAVGSFVDVTRFQPSAITLPSLTTMAPNGPPAPSRMRSAESRTAWRMRPIGSASMQRRVLAGGESVLAADEEVRGDRRGDRGRLLAADAGQAYRTGQALQLRGGDARITEAPYEAGALGRRADQAEIGEIVAPQHRLAHRLVERVA